jgi:hypothetical protein
MALSNPFEGMETIADDTIDREDPSLFETLRTSGLMWRRMLLDPTLTNEAFIGEQEPYTGVSDAIVAGGQSVQESLRDPTLWGSVAHRKLLSQVLDVGGQVPSAVLQQVGKIPSDLLGTDPEDNALYMLGQTLRDATKTPDEHLANENLFDDFTRALLQTAAFWGTGAGAAAAVGGGVKAGGMAAAWLGAAVGGQAGMEDAIRHGAEEWQVNVAYYANSIFGISEAAPVLKGLQRIDDLTGGVFSRRLTGKAGQLTKSAVLGFIQEGLQEGFQTVGENWTAADIAGYDPNRSPLDNLGHAVGIGGSAGMLISLVGTALGIGKRMRMEKVLADKVLEPLGLESIEELQDKLLQLDTQITDIEGDIAAQEQIIEERGNLPLAEENKLVEDAKKAKKKARREGPGMAGVHAGASQNVTIDQLADTAELKDIIAVGALEPTPEIHDEAELWNLLRDENVVIALNGTKEASNEVIKAMEKKIADLKKKEKLTPHQQKTLDKARNIVKTEKAVIRDSVRMAKDIKTFLDEILDIVGKDAQFLVHDTRAVEFGIPDSARGAFTAFRHPMTGKPINQIFLRTPLLTDIIRNNINEVGGGIYDGAAVRAAKAELYTNLLHEVGHTLAFNQFHTLYQKAKAGTATEQEKTLFRALHRDYLEFVKNNLTASTRQVYQDVFSLPRARVFGEFDSNVPISDSDGMGAFVSSLSNNEDVQIPFYKDRAQETVGYVFSFSEFLAEEFSKVASEEGLINPETAPFFQNSINEMNKIIEKSSGRFTSHTPTMSAYVKRHSLRQQLKEAKKEQDRLVKHDPLKALADAGLMDKTVAKQLGEERDVFNWFMDVGFNILQIAELNVHIEGLQEYVTVLRFWKNEVNTNLAIADDRLREWNELGRKENERLARLLLEETMGITPDGGYLKHPRAFTAEEIATYNLSDQALELREKIKKDFRRTLDQMEEVLIAAKKRIYAGDDLRAGQEILKVKKEFKEMRYKPYFPLMRFGDFITQVRAKGEQTIEGVEYKAGQLIDYQGFDTKQERDRALRGILNAYPSNKITHSVGHMTQPNFSLQGMPLTLLEHLEARLVSHNLSQETRDAIAKVKNDVLPFKSFRKQFNRRKRTHGYSLDARRSYANYMTSFSNHIARVKFDHKFKEAFDKVEKSIKMKARQDGGDFTKRAQILNHMNDHLNYVMNPVNEFVGLRSIAFIWFLGFNVKSAFVNMTQVPLVSYPYLAARYGDGKAVAQLTRAYKTAATAFTNPDALSKEIQELVEKGLNESWLDESLATEIAMAASENNVESMVPSKLRRKAWNKVTHYGTWMFHQVEKYNRHITAIAAYRLARTDGMTVESAQEAARRAVEKSQFEYARWARPRFMRGKLGGTVFVFQNYMQNALFFALGGDAGAMRMMLMLFLVAGLQGLPFGEDIGNLIDAAMTAYKKKTGAKDPHTQIRTDLRELVNEFTSHPDLILHGLSSTSFGLAPLGEAMGWPVPNLDLSGSLSMGRVIPGSEILRPGQDASFDRLVSQGVERSGGAIVSGMAGIESNASGVKECKQSCSICCTWRRSYAKWECHC